jgi:hypothetical protein
VNNISACGMSITTDKEIQHTHTLEIHFDSTGLLQPHVKLLKGEVVRKKQNSSVFKYSVRFLDLTHAEIVELDEYLRYVQNSTSKTYLLPSEDMDKSFY